MKKILMFISLLLGFAGSSYADDSFSVDNITLPQNGEADVVVRFSLDAGSTCSGYTLWLQLPEGLEFVTYEKNEKTYITYTAGDCYDETPTITPNLDEGYLKVGCLTANSDPLNKQSGVLVTFRVKPTSTHAVGTPFTGTLTNGTISAEDGSVHNVANSTFTITIDEPEDGRIKFDETATKLPTYTGEKGDVSMKRTINANEWSTIVLPFTLTQAKAKAIFGDDVQLAEFAGFVADYGDDEENVVPLSITINLTAYTMSARKGMTGGKPFFIKTSKSIESFTADDVTLTDAVTDVTKEDEFNTPGKFTGTLVKSIVPNDGLFINGEKFWYSTGKTNVKAFRCWFELGAVLDKETDFSSRIFMNFVDNEATGIRNIKSSEDGKYFDLLGRGVKPTKKGLYIKDGKKVVIK